MATGTGPGTRLTDVRLAPVVVVGQHATLLDVAQAMIRTGVSALVIGDGDAIITERDLVSALSLGRPPSDPAMSAATARPWSIRRTQTALDALAAMVRYGVRHLVVVDDTGAPVGVAPLAGVAEAVLGDSEIPQWLTAFRLALRADTRRGDADPYDDRPWR